MYNLSYFKEQNQQTIIEFIENHPFAVLTGSFLSGKQVATQIPILLDHRDGNLFLQGHIMNNTDHHKAFLENPNVLALFSGAHAYISASWYTNPHIGSTWNYISVQISGQFTTMTEPQLIQFMKKLTLKFENQNTQSPTIYENLPDSFINQMMPAIIGFEIKAQTIENTFKLSQNRDQQSYLNIISKLEQTAGHTTTIAQEMKKRQHSLFQNTNTPPQD